MYFKKYIVRQALIIVAILLATILSTFIFVICHLETVGIICLLFGLVVMLIFLLKLYPISLLYHVTIKTISNLEKEKEYYLLSIKDNFQTEYKNNIINQLKSYGFKDKSSLIKGCDYSLFSKKHYFTLDSTCINFHIQTPDTVAATLKFFEAVSSNELNSPKALNGQYSSKIAIAIVENLDFSEKELNHFLELKYVKSTVIINVVIDVLRKRLYFALGNDISYNRGKRKLFKYILKIKGGIKSLEGPAKNNIEAIANMKESLSEENFKKIKNNKINNENARILNAMKDKEVSFIKDEEGGAEVYYKNNERGLMVYCNFNQDTNHYELIGLDSLKWIFPKKTNMKKQERHQAIKDIANHLFSKDILFDIIILQYDQKIMQVLEYRISYEEYCKLTKTSENKKR